MNRIDSKFRSLKKEKRKALIAYVTAGFPSLAGTDRAVRALEAAGADIVEIGVPFSDPIADGPTIQYSSQKALEKGISLSAILAWMRRFRASSQLPLVLMSYLNPIHRMGYASFARRAAAAGADGLIVPDLIPEEAGPLRQMLRKAGLHLIHLVAPTTPPARRKWVARKSRGFLYAVSLTGVTGARRDIPPEIAGFLDSLRRASPVPAAVGFGISRPEQVRALAPHADGVIVGSALVDILRRRAPLGPFIRSLRRALDAPVDSRDGRRIK